MRPSTRAGAIATAVLATIAALSFAWGCSGWVPEGLDPATLPSDVQSDYALFAVRCSKCHSLARPLTSGIDDDNYWVDYVARMRRQPASGISAEDTVGILRFLHYFSLEEKRKSGKLPAEMQGKTAAPAPAPSPAPTPSPSPRPSPSPSPARVPSPAPAPATSATAPLTGGARP